MQIKTNHRKNSKNTWEQLLKTVAFLFLLILSAKLDIDLGGIVSFTFQTLFLGIAYYYLPKRLKLVMILSYILLGIVGFPVFNGGSGWAYFSSWPLGFFSGFILATLVSKPHISNFYTSLNFFIQIHVVIVFFGIVGVGIYANSVSKAIDTCLDLVPGAVIKSVLGALVILAIQLIAAEFKSKKIH